MGMSTWNEPGHASGSILACLALLLPFGGTALAQDAPVNEIVPGEQEIALDLAPAIEELVSVAPSLEQSQEAPPVETETPPVEAETVKEKPTPKPEKKPPPKPVERKPPPRRSVAEPKPLSSDARRGQATASRENTVVQAASADPTARNRYLASLVASLRFNLR